MKYNKEELISYIHKKRNVVFLLFVLATAIFWFLSRLSNNYTQQIHYAINYQDLPKRFVFQDEPPKVLSVSVNASGFYLLSNSLKQKTIKISLQNLRRKSKYQYYLLSDELNRQVRETFHDRIQILGVSQDSLFINLGNKKYKKVPVISNLDLKYTNGYKSFNMTLQPDSIIVSGPEMQVAKVTKVELTPLKREGVMESINEKIALLPSKLPKVKFNKTEVLLSLDVEKITEKKIEVPVKIVNPPVEEIVIYPKKISVTLQVKLSLFQEITANDFLIVCDYQKKEDKYIKVKLETYPKNVSNIKLKQDKVEFLILK